MAPASSKTTSSSGINNKKKANPDFKRIKAKVGKKAPKPLNATDTSFRAASVHVRAQHAVRTVQDRLLGVETSVSSSTLLLSSSSSSSGELYSSRGKSLNEIVTQLQHPASAVRLSAAKGLEDLVANTTSPSHRLEAHLSVLLPAVSKCACVDEDDEVRQVGWNILRDLIVTQLTVDRARIVLHASNPYGQWLVAFTASALNSLDRATRRDGARVLALLCDYLPGLVAPLVATRLLPSLVRVLAERTLFPKSATSSTQSQSVAVSQAANGQKRRASNNKRKRPSAAQKISGVAETATTSYSLAKTLRLLLETRLHDTRRTDELELTTSSMTVIRPEIMVIKKHVHKASIALPGRIPSTTTRPLYHIQTLSDLVPALADDSNVSKCTPGWSSSSSSPSASSMSLSTALDLLKVLYESMVEVVEQQSHCGGTNNLPLSVLQTHVHILSILRTFFVTFGNDLMIVSNASSEKEQKQFVKVSVQIVSLALEIFPIYFPQKALMDEANAMTCLAVITILSKLTWEAAQDKNHEWIQRIAEYAMTALENLASSPPPSTEIRTNCTASVDSSIGIHYGSSILLVFRHIVTNHSLNLDDNSTKLRRSMVKLFCQTFFPASGRVTLAMAQSRLGRQAVRLGCDIFAMLDFGLEKAKSEFGNHIVSIVQCLPEYLNAWAGSFPHECAVAIDLIHEIVRQILDTSCALCDHLRTSLASLVATDGETRTTPSTLTTLEQLPEQLQRHAVSILVLLGSPTTSTMNGLGLICARARWRLADAVSDETADYIVHAVHSIRRTVPMQCYLSFLMESTGLLSTNVSMLQAATTTSATAASIPRMRICEMDGAIREVSNCIMDCGSAKILPKLNSLLCKWLESGWSTEKKRNEPASAHASINLMRLRAALVLLARTAVDQLRSMQEGVAVLADCLEQKRVVDAIVGLFRSTNFHFDREEIEHTGSEKPLMEWISPALQLLTLSASVSVLLFPQMVEAVVATLENEKIPETANISAMECLLVTARLNAVQCAFQPVDEKISLVLSKCISILRSIAASRQRAGDHGDNRLQVLINHLISGLTALLHFDSVRKDRQQAS